MAHALNSPAQAVDYSLNKQAAEMFVGLPRGCRSWARTAETPRISLYRSAALKADSHHSFDFGVFATRAQDELDVGGTLVAPIPAVIASKRRGQHPCIG